MNYEAPRSSRQPMPKPTATDSAPGWRVGAQRRLVVLLACYSLLFLVSAIGGPLRIEPPIPIRPEFLGNLMLIVGGSAATLWLGLVGGGRGLLAAALIGGLAWLIEGVGQATGLLFGSYRYTGALTPVLPGGVPLAIVGAWLLVVVGALGTATWLRPGAGRAWLIGVAGLLFTLITLLFTLMNLAYGYLVPAAIGVGLLVLLVVRARRPR
jgi:hypothetical protein